MTTKRDAADAFLLLWSRLGDASIAWIGEYRFTDTRRWRFDAAHPGSMVAVEIEGVNPGGKSRHTQANGYQADCEKYNAAIEEGWAVLRYTQLDLTSRPVQMIEQIQRVVASRSTGMNK